MASIEDNSEDEEISIDFSKIKSFFKKKKEQEAEEVKKETEKAKEEVQKKIEKEEKKLEILKKDEDKIREAEAEAEKEEEEAKTADDAQEKAEEDIKKTKKKIEEAKEDIEKEDEEISIDFGKIKKFFKGDENKKAEIKTTKYREEEKEDDEISLDFGKVKNFFKGIGKAIKEPSKEKTEDEFSFEFQKIGGFFNQHKKIIVPLILILIAMSFSIYLRIQPAHLPITDDWARDAVYNSIKSQIRSDIDKQYPNLPDANKNPLVEAQFNKVLKEQGSQINQQIEGTSNYFKSRLQNENGQTYLVAIDPYFWMRHAKNILDHGYPGDEIRDGVQWDNHMYAPNGRPADVSFHSYFLAYLYKFSAIFGNQDLMKSTFYAPVIISALAIIPAFFIARRFGGNFGGFIAAFIVAIHPAFLTRTVGGFADTDAYNVFFPLVITWLFLEAFEATSRKRGVVFGISAGFFSGLYAFTWLGWWYIFDFILVTLAFYIAYYVLLHRKEVSRGMINFVKNSEIKNIIIITLIFIVSSALFTALFANFSTFKNFLGGSLDFAKLKEVGITTVWPNVYTTVAEQNPASLHNVINQIGFGNNFLFVIGLLGLIFTVLRKKNIKIWFLVSSVIWYLLVIAIEPQNLNFFMFLIAVPLMVRLFIAIKDKEYDLDVREGILLFLWLAATIYASTKGIRFTLLLVPAFSILFGIAMGFIYKYFSKWVTEGFHINKYLSKIAIIIVLILLLVGPYNSAKATAKNDIPSMNDAWYESLDKIKRESAPDAIINSWWDFGHWFKMIGDRAVTFDGTSQSSPQAHWIGLTLLTENEELAVGILRMLDCSGYSGGTYAFDAVQDVTNDTPRSIDIMYEIMVLDKEDAKKALKKHNFKDKEIENVLKYTHCEPPEDYFITSEDMISKSGVWAHFGSWNFNRALIYNTLKKKEYKDNKEKGIEFLQKRFNYSVAEAENMFNEVQAITSSDEANHWIAPWPSYASGLSGCSVTGNIAKCGNGLNVNLSDYNAWLPTQQGNMHPKILVYANENGIVNKEFNESTIPYGATLIPEGEGYKSILMSPELAASMFTRMFFMDGHGLTHFKLFSYQRSITGGEVYVWKVNWTGAEPNIMEEFKEEEIKEEANETESTAEEITETGPEENETGIKTDENNLSKTISKEEGAATEEQVEDTEKNNSTASNESA